MRFLLGVLVGYTLRGKQKLLIRFLVTLAGCVCRFVGCRFAGNCAFGAES